ncbi:phage tail tape measure protein [Xanthomonas hortorum]|uniref:phage tail tape measure protein n=2 Tax=Xanthomonas hortorum TaxID=56454 RepID=UPI000CED99C7|nr:phage tail tape measure protein [Xanthomonas hortorum]MCE4373426.1 phage tail tape measure protein [Xanthomonas hortorum pv. hederae]PPU75895.1 phage tail tape measure protein [Xanthomonas hortorum pv. hederae]PUE95719.1 phage tail tape measure protein [Xanthomonas hortorum pv. hederae]
MADQSANLRVRISADLNDIKQGLAVLRGQLSDVRKQAGQSLPSNNVISQLGKTSGQTSQALAQLPMQFTDIFTSIQGGMPWFTILVQQGGQIKDSFGGIGPALKGVSTAVLAMVNPLTVSAAVIAALALAWKQGEDRSFEFSKALIGTGNYAAASTVQLEGLVSKLDQLDGVSLGGAREAVLKVAESGKFAGKQFDQVAASAAMMQATTGQAIDETIAKFEDIRKNPVEALLKLNETEHFLTQTQLERISTLVEEGNKQQAVAEAIQLYDTHLENVAQRTKASMPAISKAWLDVKDAISGAWGELGTYVDLLGKAVAQQGKLNFSPGRAVSGVGMAQGSLLSLLPEGTLPNAGMLANALGKQWLRQKASARPDFSNVVKTIDRGPVVDSEQARASLKFQDDTNSRLSKTLDLEGQIKQMKEDAAKAGVTDAKLLAAREKVMRAEAAAKGAKGATSLATAARSAGLQSIKDAFTAEQSQITTSTKILQAQYQAREVSAETYYQRMRELAERGTAAEAQSLQKQIDYLNSRNVSGKQSIDVNKQVGELEAQLAKVRAEGAAALQVLSTEEGKLRKQREDALASYQAALNASTDALQEDMDAMIARVGAGDREYEIQQRLNGVYKEQAQRLNELALQKNAGRIDEATAAAEEAAVRAATERRVQVIRDGYERMAEAQADWGKGASAAWANYRDEASNAAGMVESATTSGLASFEDMVVKATKTGKLSFSEMADSIIADFVRINAKRGISSLLGAFFGGGASAGAVSGTMGTFGNNINEFIRGKADGGYTGPGGKFEPAGVVHKGEGVLSQRDIASIGGPGAFLSLLSTIRSGRGYAAGGLVGSTVMPSVAGVGGMSVEINNYSGQPAQQREERTRGPDGSELRKLIVDVGAADIASGGRMAGAMKNRFALKEGR